MRMIEETHTIRCGQCAVNIVWGPNVKVNVKNPAMNYHINDSQTLQMHSRLCSIKPSDTRK